MANLQSTETIDTRPFKRLVVQLGSVPTDFTEGMTFYEILAWICNYIENTIIPHVNSNTESYNNLVKEFKELKEYVDTYLTNLDELTERVDTLEAEIYDRIYQLCLECKNEILQIIANNELIYQGKLDELSLSVDERFRNWSQQLIINDPVTGEASTVQAALNSVYDVTRTEALTALEYDNLELTALAYDEHELTALAYDTLGKNLLSA